MSESTSATPETPKREAESGEPSSASGELLSTRGRMGKVTGVRIAATGSSVPNNVVTNEDLAELGCDSEWIIRRTGIRERRHVSADVATSDLCYEAAIKCIEKAGISIDQIDMILVATMTPDHWTPSTACHLQRRLGAVAPAMDVNAACAGFMYGLVTGAQFVATGNSRNVLIVGSDLMSRMVDPQDKKTYPLFGDAAAAVLLTKDEGQAGILSYQIGSEGCGGEMLCIPAGGTRMPTTPETMAEGKQYLAMDGRNVFKWAVRVFDESAKEVLRDAQVDANQLKLVILHQANQRIIDSAVSDLNVPPEKVYVNLDRYGNTSAASIPLALDEAVREGKIKKNDLVLMCGFGAGLAWGTALLRF